MPMTKRDDSCPICPTGYHTPERTLCTPGKRKERGERQSERKREGERERERKGERGREGEKEGGREGGREKERGREREGLNRQQQQQQQQPGTCLKHQLSRGHARNAAAPLHYRSNDFPDCAIQSQGDNPVSIEQKAGRFETQKAIITLRHASIMNSKACRSEWQERASQPHYRVPSASALAPLAAAIVVLASPMQQVR